MGVNHLTSAKPKRLYRDASSWVLEIERLMPLDDRILRPTTQRLVGEEVVLYQLGNSDEGRGLVGDARRLMGEGAPDASYSVVEGRWVPSAFADQVNPPAPAARARAESKDKAPALSAASLELCMLREDLKQLRGAYDKLLRRVADLERGIVVPGAHASGGGLGPSVGAAPAIASAAQIAPDARTPAPPAETEPEPVAAADEAAPAPMRVHLPTADALSAQVIAMTGDKSPLTVAKKPLDLATPDVWVSLIIDDADVVVGAMLATLEATVTFGGKLMVLPEHEIADQIKARLPTEEVSSAMGEILNVSTAAFNAVPDSAHVRAVPIEPLDLAKLSWLGKPGPRIDLVDAHGAALAFVLKLEGS